MNKEWMIYGANGYNGALIAKEAVKRGHRPILAGRNRVAIEALAKKLDTDYRIFDLLDNENVERNLSDVDLLLNCAGPFTHTVKALLTACFTNKCHYLDITGELDVFEYCFGEQSMAEQADCIVCPGIAFDIVATEVAAAKLKELLPSAKSIKLGFDGQKMTLSPGSIITGFCSISPNFGAYMVREDGKIVNLAKPRIENIAFEADKPPQKAMTVTWADINGAFYSTNVPNIAIYMPAIFASRAGFSFMTRFKPLYSLKRVQSFLTRVIKQRAKGPSASELESESINIFGEASTPNGEVAHIYFKVPHGYKFTYLAAVTIAEHCLSSQRKGGYYTPSMLMGTDFVPTIEGSSNYHIEYAKQKA